MDWYCRNPLIVPIYGPYGMDNCIMVSIEVMNEDYEQHNLFFLVPSVRSCRSTVGIMVFWPRKYLLMNDEEVVIMKDQCHVIVYGVNNFLKK